MKVYVLFLNTAPDLTVIGVYTQRELAERDGMEWRAKTSRKFLVEEFDLTGFPQQEQNPVSGGRAE